MGQHDNLCQHTLGLQGGGPQPPPTNEAPLTSSIIRHNVPIAPAAVVRGGQDLPRHLPVSRGGAKNQGSSVTFLLVDVIGKISGHVQQLLLAVTPTAPWSTSANPVWSHVTVHCMTPASRPPTLLEAVAGPAPASSDVEQAPRQYAASSCSCSD